MALTVPAQGPNLEMKVWDRGVYTGEHKYA